MGKACAWDSSVVTFRGFFCPLAPRGSDLAGRREGVTSLSPKDPQVASRGGSVCAEEEGCLGHKHKGEA